MNAAAILEPKIDPLPNPPPTRATQLSTVLLFLLPAMALTTDLSLGLIEAVLVIAAIGYAIPLVRQYQQRTYRTAPDSQALITAFASARLVTLAFVFNLVSALFSMALTGFSGNYLENPLKTVVATSAVSLILLVRPLPRYFWIGIFVGTIGAATLALIQRFFMLMPRAEGFSMPITFGDIAMAMGLMSLASVQPFAKTRWAALPYISFIAGLVASILSGSRGGWLALLLSFIPLYSYGRFALGRRIIVIFCVGILLISGAIYLPQTGVQGRLLDVSREITLYRNGNPNTSVGARLEMWKGAWLLFREHPLMGVGRIHYNAGMRDLIGRGVIDPTMRDYRHAHNEWLHALATEGIFGAIALLALYGAPILFFTRQLRQDGLHRPYALAGLLLILSYIDFGLTQVMFAHHVSSAFYAVTVCALIGVCLQYQSAAAGVKA